MAFARLMPMLILLLLGGCVHNTEPDVKVAEAPAEDRTYAKALTKATIDRTIYKDFETRYIIGATYLSPAFRSALSGRLERVYKQGQVQLEEADSKAGFFITLHSPDEDRVDLTNPHHWTILLAQSGATAPIKPIIVKRLDDKERWRALFPNVNEWTTEYLVIFDTPSVDANSPDLVAKSSISLTFANADAQVNLVW